MSTNEWYTQPKYIEAARLVLKTIDLDPASSDAANKIVKAERYFDEAINGLDQPWSGRVWLNPPYTRTLLMQGHRMSLIGLFVKKLIKTYESEDITEAIALVTTEVNAKWFQPLWPYLICFPDHRVNFIIPGGAKHKYSQMFGSCFVYLGPNKDRFIEIFSKFGTIVGRVSPAREVHTNMELWSEV